MGEGGSASEGSAPVHATSTFSLTFNPKSSWVTTLLTVPCWIQINLHCVCAQTTSCLQTCSLLMGGIPPPPKKKLFPASDLQPHPPPLLTQHGKGGGGGGEVALGVGFEVGENLCPVLKGWRRWRRWARWREEVRWGDLLRGQPICAPPSSCHNAPSIPAVFSTLLPFAPLCLQPRGKVHYMLANQTSITSLGGNGAGIFFFFPLSAHFSKPPVLLHLHSQSSSSLVCYVSVTTTTCDVVAFWQNALNSLFLNTRSQNIFDDYTLQLKRHTVWNTDDSLHKLTSQQ